MKNRSSQEITICGKKSVDKLAKLHPERIRRLFFSAEAAPDYGEVCRYLAANRKIYRLVENAELEKITASIHHGGVAAVIDMPPFLEPGPLEISSWCQEQRRLLVLDNVANSHNLGAMVRTAAFLGIKDILISGLKEQDDSLITSACYRTAEGGMELSSLWRISNLPDFMDRFGFNPKSHQPETATSAKRGIGFIGADHHAKTDLIQLPNILSQYPESGLALAIIMGNEEIGIQPEVLNRCLITAKIKGSGKLESLNVAQAAAIFMHSLR